MILGEAARVAAGLDRLFGDIARGQCHVRSRLALPLPLSPSDYVGEIRRSAQP